MLWWLYWSSIAAIDPDFADARCKVPLSLMEYADGGLYQQSALSGALNKPGFPHRGLTCLAITSCLPGQSVVLFLSY
jgi:hypothetical protein